MWAFPIELYCRLAAIRFQVFIFEQILFSRLECELVGELREGMRGPVINDQSMIDPDAYPIVCRGIERVGLRILGRDAASPPGRIVGARCDLRAG